MYFFREVNEILVLALRLFSSVLRSFFAFIDCENDLLLKEMN